MATPRKLRSENERFMRKVVKLPNGCWGWTGSQCRGRGIFIAKNSCSAQRYSYTYFVGPVPEGLRVYHKCNTKICVNPEHLKCEGLEDKFLARVKKTNSCWLWTGFVNPDSGYGQFCVKKFLTTGAHRMAYQLYVGEIPNGLVLDHICRNRACVNPKHLRAVTQRENTLCGIGISAENARKTHCKRGHPLTGDNLLVNQTKGKNPSRSCIACRRMRAKRDSITRYKNK